MQVRGPKNVGRALGRAVQTDPKLLRYASVITEQKECWELFFQTVEILRNKMQQGVQADATYNIQMLANNVSSVCTGLYSSHVFITHPPRVFAPQIT